AVQMGGIRVLLTDTAGLRETGDAVERIGVERARKALSEADVLLVLDGASPLTQEDREALFGLSPQLVVLSKGDFGIGAERGRSAHGIRRCADGHGLCAARRGIGRAAKRAADVCADGRRGILCAFAGASDEAAQRACAALNDAVVSLEDGMPLDVAAVDLSAALDALGEITGETMSEKVIDEVFARFCVGK
ncbi:MAG: hypothetical protein V8Q79_07655, partial [Christensenellales bacterium]